MRVVEPEGHAGVHVDRRSDSLPDGEGRLVHELAHHPAQHEPASVPDPFGVEAERGAEGLRGSRRVLGGGGRSGQLRQPGGRQGRADQDAGGVRAARLGREARGAAGVDGRSPVRIDLQPELASAVAQLGRGAGHPHRRGVAGGLERPRILTAVATLAAVLVPTAPRLAPQAPRGHHARLKRARLPARLPEGERGEGLGDLVAHVDPHEVHQLERAHAKAAAQAADAVHLLGRRDSLLHDPQRLGPERAARSGSRGTRARRRPGSRACPSPRRSLGPSPRPARPSARRGSPPAASSAGAG